MGKAKTPLLKQNVAKDIMEGVPYREIVKKYNISIGLVNKIKNQNSLNSTGNKYGRPKKLSLADAREARQLIVPGEANTAVEVTQILNQEYSLNISSKTVRRCLKSSGLAPRTKLKKPYLSEQNRKSGWLLQKSTSILRQTTG